MRIVIVTEGDVMRVFADSAGSVLVLNLDEAEGPIKSELTELAKRNVAELIQVYGWPTDWPTKA